MANRPFDLPFLRKLEPRAARYVYADDSTPGLVLVLAPSGARSFYWKRRIGSRMRWVRLGGIDDFAAIKDVRALAAGHNAALSQGVDPVLKRQQERAAALTFGELWTMYFERWAKVRKRDWKMDLRRYKSCLAKWAPRNVEDITRADAVALLERIAATSGPIQANRARALAHKVFNWAAGAGMDFGNPFAHTPRNRETAKTRYLLPGELRALWKALDNHPDNDLRDWVRLALLTGVRGGTLGAARWADLSLADSLWNIPPESMKAGKPLALPIAPRVVTILRARQAVTAGPWVFPSPRWASGHLEHAPRCGFEALLAQCKIEGVTPHDLRRTHATYGLQAGVPIEILGRALGHSPVGGAAVTHVYAVAGLDLVRLAVERTVGAILAVAEADEDAAPAAVLQFRPLWAGAAS